MAAVTLSTASMHSTAHPPVEESQLRKLARLIAEVSRLFSQISQNDRQETMRIEKRYLEANIKVADAIRTNGNLGLYFTPVTLLLTLASFPMSDNYQKLTQIFADKGIGAIHSLISGNYSAKQKLEEGQAHLQSQKLQEKVASRQGDSNTKSEFNQVLQAELQRLNRAAAAGG